MASRQYTLSYNNDTGNKEVYFHLFTVKLQYNICFVPNIFKKFLCVDVYQSRTSKNRNKQVLVLGMAQTSFHQFPWILWWQNAISASSTVIKPKINGFFACLQIFLSAIQLPMSTTNRRWTERGIMAQWKPVFHFVQYFGMIYISKIFGANILLSLKFLSF